MNMVNAPISTNRIPSGNQNNVQTDKGNKEVAFSFMETLVGMLDPSSVNFDSSSSSSNGMNSTQKIETDDSSSSQSQSSNKTEVDDDDKVNYARSSDNTGNTKNIKDDNTLNTSDVDEFEIVNNNDPIDNQLINNEIDSPQEEVITQTTQIETTDVNIPEETTPITEEPATSGKQQTNLTQTSENQVESPIQDQDTSTIPINNTQVEEVPVDAKPLKKESFTPLENDESIQDLPDDLSSKIVKEIKTDSDKTQNTNPISNVNQLTADEIKEAEGSKSAPTISNLEQKINAGQKDSLQAPLPLKQDLNPQDTTSIDKYFMQNLNINKVQIVSNTSGSTFSDTSSFGTFSSNTTTSNFGIEATDSTVKTQVNFKTTLQQIRTPGSSQSEMIDKIVQLAKMKQSQGKSSIKMLLNPPHLGTLKMSLVVKSGELHANMEAETVAAKNLLLNNLNTLKDSLKEQGIMVQQFSVNVTPDWQGASSQNEQFENSRKNRNSSSFSISGLSSIEEPVETEVKRPVSISEQAVDVFA